MSTTRTSMEGGRPRTAEGARERILARVDAALATRDPLPHPGALPQGAFAPAGPLDEVIRRFADALGKSGGQVVRLKSSEAQGWLREFATGFASAAVGPGVPAELRPALPEADPREAELGVSLAVGAAAATGSLLLDSREGRRLQLLPPTHLVWIDAQRVFFDLGSALEAARAGGALPAVLALHSGPSKSADIGRIIVTGVHGPGRLIAAVVEDLSAETSHTRGALACGVGSGGMTEDRS